MKLLPALTRFSEELISLIYPKLCLVCEKGLPAKDEGHICFSCLQSLPYTDYYLLPENPVTDRLAGRIPLVFGGAYCYYRSKGSMQPLIHALKYYNKPEIGNRLGSDYGLQLKGVKALADVDYLLPVPIHPKRLHERGYNQAEKIAQGIAQRLNKPVLTDALVRRKFEASQTKKGLDERARNVSEVFGVATSARLDKRHVLLVDDVLTTGATIEACADSLLAAFPNIRISVAMLGITEQ